MRVNIDGAPFQHSLVPHDKIPDNIESKGFRQPALANSTAA